jgi:hypothetical protein
MWELRGVNRASKAQMFHRAAGPESKGKRDEPLNTPNTRKGKDTPRERIERKEYKAFNHGLHGLHGWIGQQSDKPQNEMATAEYAEHAENCIWRAHKKSFSNCAILWDSTAKEEMLEYCRELHGRKYSG